MATNAEVSKTGSESALSTIRKFSRKVQGTGLVKIVRGQRYFERDKSKTVNKKRALKLLKRRAEFKQLVKEGKVAEREPRRGSQSANQSQAQANAQSSNVPASQARFGENTPIAR
jgi:ribosomal protein S21